MAQQTINVGAAPNDGTGTPLRTAFQYTNSNFTELYTAVGPSGNNIVVPGTATITGDLTVDTSTLKVDSANNRVGIGTATPQQTLDVSGTINSTQARFGNVNGRGLTIATALVAGVNEAGSVFNALGSGSGAHIFQVDSVEQYRIAPLGVFTWSDGAGGTRMTLNSTGLGVGVTPSVRFDSLVADAAECGRFRAASGWLRVHPYLNATDYCRLQAVNGTNTALIPLTLEGQILRFNTNGGLAATLDASGRLLVGGTNAFTLTDGTGATFTPKFYSQSTSGAEGVGVLIADGTNQRRIGLFVDQTNGFYGISGNFSAVEPTFVIRSGSSERVRIDTAGNLIWSPAATPPTLATNGQLTVNATSNTNLRFSYRGSDGVTRVANITLA
jgi:hypothetical protein